MTDREQPFDKAQKSTIVYEDPVGAGFTEVKEQYLKTGKSPSRFIFSTSSCTCPGVSKFWSMS